MNVLIACEESQVECKAFRDRGHMAFSCDVQECSGGHPEWHVVADCRKLITDCCWISSFNFDIHDEMLGTFVTQDGNVHELPPRWDLIIAHPPCTFISNAGARWLYPGGKLNYDRFKKGIEAAEFLKYFLRAPCDKIAVENPVPSKIFRLPNCDQIIQPYEFGDSYSKRTCLWLKGLPKLVPTEIVNDYVPYISSGMYSKTHDIKYRGISRKGGSSITRSKSFDGIAKAMAAQWG